MASFTDRLSQFNPYIQELPVQEMYQVGMAKQAQYNQGVQKIQNYIDRVAGVDVYRDVDKQYLQSKLGELGNKLKTVAAGDFSNQQLVNSVAGMTSQIAKDPLINNAVSSTAAYRNGLMRIQKDTDEGKSNPANVSNFNKQAQPWLTSQKAGEVFNGSYKPHFDIMKFAKEQFDAIKPGKWSFDQIYETDSDGNYKVNVVKNKNGTTSKEFVVSPYMLRMQKEGRLPAEVTSTLNQIFSDPRVKQQLQITGEYDYANIDPRGLVDMTYDQRDRKTADYNNAIAELRLKKTLEKKDDDKKFIQGQIDKLQSQLDAVNGQYDKIAEVATTNPDYVRGFLYKESSLSNLTNMYGSVKESKEVMDNPLWNANFKEFQEANRMKIASAENAFKYTSLAEQSRQKQLDRENALKIAAMKGSGKKTGTGAPGDKAGIPSGLEHAENQSDMDIIASTEQQRANAANDMLDAGNKLIWDGMFANDPKNIQKLNQQMSLGKTREQGIDTIIKNTADANKESVVDFVTRFSQKTIDALNANPGGVPPALRDSYDLFKKKQKTYQSINQEYEDVDKAVAKIYGTDLANSVKGVDIKDTPMQFQGKDVVVTKQDFYDLALYAKGHASVGGWVDSKVNKEAAASAEKRLNDRGKGFLIPTVLDKFASSYLSPSGVIRDVKSTIRQGVELLPFTDDVYLRNAKGYDINEERDPFSINLKKMYSVIDKESTPKILQTKAELLKNKNFFKPEVKMAVLTGDTETDRQTLNDVRRWTLEYGRSGKNLASSDDLNGMTKAIGGDLSDISLEAKTFTGPGGRKYIQVLGTDLKHNNSGSIVITDDEAKNLGIDVSALYESDEITNVRRAITRSPIGSTSKLDPSDVSTYTQGDAYFEKFEFPRMKGVTRYDMKANIVYSNGLYYGYVYANDGTKKNVASTEGDPDLNVLITSLKTMGPEFAQFILK